MEMLSIIFLVFLIIGIPVTYVMGKVKFGVEKETDCLKNIQCGGSIGNTNLIFPFVRHTIYEQAIVIAYGYKRYTLLFKDITLVSKSFYISSGAIRYHHNNPHIPKKIIIRSNDISEILKILNLHNIKIE